MRNQDWMYKYEAAEYLRVLKSIIEQPGKVDIWDESKAKFTKALQVAVWDLSGKRVIDGLPRRKDAK